MNMIRHHIQACSERTPTKNFSVPDTDRRPQACSASTPHASVEQRLDFLAIPSQQLLLFMPGEGRLGSARLFENHGAFVLQAGDLVGGIESPSRKVTK